MKKIYSFIGVLIMLLALAAESSAQTKILDNGPDAVKKVIAVLEHRSSIPK